MKAPKPPDPYKTAAAQQSSEIGAAGASSVMNNPNIVTPYGSQSYSISGWEQVPDATGKMISVPRYTQTQQLSPDQQRLMGLQTQMSYNTGQTGVEQSAKLRQHLQGSIDPSGWQGWNAGPQAAKLATTFADVGGPQRQIAGGGNIATTYGSGGNIQKSIAGQNVRQDTGATDRAAIEKAIMQNYTQDTQGQHAQQDAQMAARGLAPGSSQYGGMYQQREQARGRAGREAYLASGQEARQAQDAYNQAANQRFQMGATQGQFANSAQQQAEDQAAQRAGFANAAQLQQFQQNAAQGQFANQAQQQAYQQALGRAGFSNEALSQMYQMGGQTADRANALRGMQSQEAFALRNQPINEIAALQGGSQVTLPQFSPYQGQGINSANIGQYIGNNYAQQANAASQFNSGLFNVAGAAAGAIPWSDRRLKTDIHHIDGNLAGAPLYLFKYGFDPSRYHVGVMADEVRLLHPDAVRNVGGYDQVDYELLASRHEGDRP